MDKEVKNTDTEGLIDVKDLFVYIWNKKFLVLLSSVCIGLFSIFYSYTLIDEYIVVVSLTEAKTDKETAMSGSSDSTFGFSLPGGFGGGNGLSAEMNKAMVMMKSWDFIDEFIRINDLEVPLLAGIGWDPSSRSLILDADKYNEKNGEWVNEDFDINSPQIRWELYKKFLDEMTIVGDKNTGIHKLAITSYSPDLALEWANAFYKLVNFKMREKKLSVLNNNIRNLDKQITTSINTTLRERLYDIQSEQIKSKVVIEASPEYVFEAIGSPLVPYQKSYPRRTIIVIGISTVGFILSIIFLVIYRFIKTKTKIIL